MFALDGTLIGRELPAIKQTGARDVGREEAHGRADRGDVALVDVGTCEGTLVGLPASGHYGQAWLDICGEERG